MRLNIHAGHGKQDSKSCGSEGLIKESIEDRRVKDEVIRLFKSKGHTVFDCTIDYPSSKSDCINKIVTKCNSNSVDLDVSIHFNSGAEDEKGNGKTTGVEVLVYNTTTKAYKYAQRVCNRISQLGFCNRGVKTRTDLGVLKTKNPNMLIECCFVDDKDDINKYEYKTIAKAIVEGILDETIVETTINNASQKLALKNGDYSSKKARVIVDVLNVRFNRGTNYEAIAKLKKGQIVNLNYCIDDWISIDGFKGNKGLGYVHTDYLELI